MENKTHHQIALEMEYEMFWGKNGILLTKSNTMSGTNEGQEKCEVKLSKVEEIIESARYICDDVGGLRNRLYSACERVGVHFDPHDKTDDAPPSYGSLPQAHEKINEIGRVVQECHELASKLERFV